MSVIDKILWLLSDGEWHDLKELEENAALSKFGVEIAVTFLREYDFIQLNTETRRIKLQPSMLDFINKIQRIEKGEVLRH